MQSESSIQEHWERARKRVAEMGDPRKDETNPRAQQARLRAQRERQERLDQAMEELEKLHKLKAARSSSKWVSTTAQHYQDRATRYRAELKAIQSR